MRCIGISPKMGNLIDRQRRQGEGEDRPSVVVGNRVDGFLSIHLIIRCLQVPLRDLLIFI